MNDKDNRIVTGGKLANKYFIMILIVSFCLNIDQNLFNNAVPLYITYLGGGTRISGMITVPFAITAIIARIISGYLADHAGRRVTIAAGCFIFGVTAILFGMTGSFVLLFILRACHGFGYSCANTPISAATMDTCPPEKQKQASGLFYVPSALSIAVCGVIVVAFTKTDSYRLLFTLAGAVLVIGGVIALICNYEKLMDFRADKNTDSGKYHGIAKFFDKSAARAASISLISCISTALIISFVLLFAQEKGIANSGMFFTVSAIVMLVFNLTVEFILKKVSEVATLVFTMAFLLCGFVALGLTGSTFAYFFLAVGYGMCFGLTFPVVYSLGLRDAPPERRGAASGTVLVSNDIGIGVGSAIWGVAIDLIGYEASFVIAGLILISAIVCAVVFFGKKKTA